MRYLPHTEEEVRDMLRVAGLENVDDLFRTIPEEARLGRPLNVPPALGEARLMRHLSEVADQNQASRMLSFMGAGAYAHHIPPAVDQLTLRSEFYTAYTPYQPEVAQGTLQAIWEFQTIVSELYGLPLANASLYDGASATAEAVLMARRLTKRRGVLMSSCVHPHYRETTNAYLKGTDVEALAYIPVAESGTAQVEALVAGLTDQTACVVVSYPSYLGPLTDLARLAQACHDVGALLVVAVPEPYALAVATPPGQFGADIVVGEGQPLACPPQYGGPGVGLFACRDDRKYLQQLPGRVCGETVDQDGKRGFVLTLSTREQHIRRERATSNICTNQGLLALAMTIRVCLLGRSGFVDVAKQCVSKARYLESRIAQLSGLSLPFHGQPYFNEFAVEVASGTQSAGDLLSRVEQSGILAGVDLARLEADRGRQFLVAVTEQHTKEDLDRFVDALSRALV